MGVVCVYLALARPGAGRVHAGSVRDALNHPELREALLAELSQQTAGVFDSHPDPDVGRVLRPALEDEAYYGARVRSNRWGLREKDYKLPKPEGLTRVVFLGDSFVFGLGAEADERMGAHLERILVERRGVPRHVECLHLGIGSWNAHSSTQFLRRTLHELRPDLVVHLLVANDVCDNQGVRGFGTMWDEDPRQRERPCSNVTGSHGRKYDAALPGNPINHGLDEESRSRMRAIGEAVGLLAHEVERAGGEYVMAPLFGALGPVFWREVAPHVSERNLLPLPAEMRLDQEYWVAPNDPHWNSAGHARFARMVYGEIRRREWLPQLQLAAWPESEEESAQLRARGRSLLARAPREDVRRLTHSLRFGTESTAALRQVYGGVDDAGQVSPRATMMLRHTPGARLRVRGRALDAPVLDGVRVRLYVEGRELPGFELEAGRPIDFERSLPPDLDGAKFVSVRFDADDWVLGGPELRACRSWVLSELALLTP